MIIIILTLLSLPTSAVLAVRTGHQTAALSVLTQRSQQIPDWTPPLVSEFDNVPVIYDPINGAVEQPPIPEPKSPVSHATEYNQKSSNWPTSTTVKVNATWPSGNTSACSGVLIADSAILTAGHCVFTHIADLCGSEETSCWAENLEIVLFQGTGERQSGYRQILTWTAWTQNHDFEYDLAGVRLNQRLGNTAGWLGFGNNVNDLIFFNEIWKNASVPFNAQNPPIITGLFQFTEIDGQQFYSDGPSVYGQSGAGTYNSENEYNHIVYCVLSHHRIFDASTYTGHTRITDVKYFAINDWIKAFDFNIYIPLFSD